MALGQCTSWADYETPQMAPQCPPNGPPMPPQRPPMTPQCPPNDPQGPPIWISRAAHADSMGPRPIESSLLPSLSDSCIRRTSATRGRVGVPSVCGRRMLPCAGGTQAQILTTLPPKRAQKVWGGGG